MPDPRASFAIARPVAARAVFAGRKRSAVEAGSGENVMLGEARIAVYAGCDGIAVLVDRMLEVDVRVVVVQILDVRGNGDAFRVRPWSRADAIARIDRVRTLRAEIGPPRAMARACLI